MLKRIRLAFQRRLARKLGQPPRLGSRAEFVVKHNFGLSTLFSRDDGGGDFHLGIALFANRKGYRFLADYFRWLAKRPIADFCEDLPDPGDHVHLTPYSDCSDEIDFTFDTLTPENRSCVLTNAGASSQQSRCGSPYRQYAQLVDEMGAFVNPWCENDDALRQEITGDLEKLLGVVEKQLAHLQQIETRP